MFKQHMLTKDWGGDTCQMNSDGEVINGVVTIVY